MGNVLDIDVRPLEKTKELTLAYLRGELGDKPSFHKISMPSVECLGRILSPKNLVLLSIIRDQKPTSITQLERLSKRSRDNLLRTIRIMHSYGLVRLERIGTKDLPRVDYETIRIHVDV